MRVINSLAILMLVSGLAQADSNPVRVNPESAVVIDGVISRGNIDEVGDAILDMAQGGVDQVDMIINSPGGEVITGFMFINKLESAKALGIHVRCFVPEVAASMAFSILTHCDERYALERSFLLWHRARVSMGGLFGQPMTGPELLKAGRDLESMDKLILKEVLSTVDMSEDDIKYHFEAETLHVAVNLHKLAPKFVTPLKFIPGLYEALANQKLPRTKSNSILFEFQQGELIYINPHLQSAGQ